MDVIEFCGCNATATRSGPRSIARAHMVVAARVGEGTHRVNHAHHGILDPEISAARIPVC